MIMLAVQTGLGAASVPIVQPPATGAPWSDAKVAALRNSLDEMLEHAPALRGAHVGFYAVDTATGNVLYARGGDAEIQPASTFKLVVGSAALDRLGPQFRFRTTLSLAHSRTPDTPAPTAPAAAATAPPASAVLTFSGDPTLSRGDLAKAAASLDGAGAIGDIVVDDSAFDRKPYADGWTWDDFGQSYAPRISAATVDENVVDVVVAPGNDVGDPAGFGLKDGQAYAAAPSAAGPAEDCEHQPIAFVRSSAVTGPQGSDDTVDVAPFLSGCQRIVGSTPLGAAPETLGIPMPDPPATIAYLFHAALAARGIANGRDPSAHADAASMQVDPPIWTHDSQPLRVLAGPSFWIPSDNLFGELLLKALGLASGGKPGSTLKGIAYENVWLRSIGVDPKTVTIADGCGMSQYDRITPRDLVTILQHDWNGPNRRLVLDSLPVGGARGTIEGIAGTDAAGRVFAKTGSMMHVRGLAGYLAPLHHGAVTFAFQVDDWNGDYPALAALRARVLSRLIDD